MKPYALSIALLTITALASGQMSFTDETNRLANPTEQSGCAIGAVDMNSDGLDDIVRLDNAKSLHIDYQMPDGSFTGYVFGNTSNSNEWSMAIADVDENGFNDIIVGGYQNDLKLLLANTTGSAYTSSDLPGPEIFLQASNFADINNDGAIDYFACHDNGINSPYRGDNTGTFVHDTSLIYTLSALPSNNSGNYGTVWTDYDGDGDLDMYLSKCRQGVFEPLDGRRMNQLWENDGSNNYTDVADSVGLRPLEQSWAADFGDMDNDGDMDCFLINHFNLSQLYENDGTNHFNDVTPTSGMTFDLAGRFGVQVILEDFDNDGLLDMLFTSYTNDEHLLFRNLGNLNFVRDTFAFPVGSPGMQSAAVGDFNRDGFPDIIGGFANGFNSPTSTSDILFMNDGNSNHWLNVRLVGDSSHINGIGARITVHSALGSQIREIRSGESYGIMNALSANFGLANDTTIDSLVVRWPSGIVDIWKNLDVDQYLTIHEGTGPCDCNQPAAHVVSSISDDGPGTLRQLMREACPADTIMFASELVGQTIELISTTLRPGVPLVINGPDPGGLTLEIENYTAAIAIPPGIKLSMSNLTIRDIEDAPLTPMVMLTNCGILRLDNVSIETQATLPPGSHPVVNYGLMHQSRSVNLNRQ